MTTTEYLAEIAVVVMLALPNEMPAAAAGRLAADLRLIVAALPESHDRSGDRVIRRDLLLAAEVLAGIGLPETNTR